PDEESLITPALRIAQGHLNPHWFHWPSLLMYVLAVPYAAYLAFERARGAALPADIVPFYLAHPSTLHLIDRAMVGIFGTLSVYVVYRLARLFFTERTALAAALFLALAPLHVRDSHFGVTDVPAACAVLVAVYATARWYLAPTSRNLVVAAACAGL